MACYEYVNTRSADKSFKVEPRWLQHARAGSTGSVLFPYRRPSQNDSINAVVFRCWMRDGKLNVADASEWAAVLCVITYWIIRIVNDHMSSAMSMVTTGLGKVLLELVYSMQLKGCLKCSNDCECGFFFTFA